MVADKVVAVESTGAEFVTAGDASCLLNIGGSLLKRDGHARALHIAEILASTRRHPFEAGLDAPRDVAKQGVAKRNGENRRAP